MWMVLDLVFARLVDKLNMICIPQQSRKPTYGGGKNIIYINHDLFKKNKTIV